VSTELGHLQLDVVPCGRFRLDGGAMFGQVPRVRWERVARPDERHRVALGTHALLVRGPDFTLLTDTGCGTRWTPEERDFFGLARKDVLAGSLAALGLAPEDITHVVLSHLHFDHAGGLFLEDGSLRFGRARHCVRGVELEAAQHPPSFQKASYRGPWAALTGSERLHRIDFDEEIVPGVRVFHTGGHTEGHQALLVDGGDGARAAFFGDLVPTTWHLPPAYTMAYDLQPSRVVARKRELLDRAAAEAWLGCFYHDPDPRLRRLGREGKRFTATA
jgi:glyoxylase-like metal-dependent hydrolase (beta-lactamase superfamily II)